MNHYIKKFLEIFRILLGVIYAIFGWAALLYSIVGGLALIIYGAIYGGENIFFLFIPGVIASVIVGISWYLLLIVYVKIFYFIIPEEFKKLIEKIFKIGLYYRVISI